jgi:hypothetical protein
MLCLTRPMTSYVYKIEPELHDQMIRQGWNTNSKGKYTYSRDRGIELIMTPRLVGNGGNNHGKLEDILEKGTKKQQ